MKFRLFPTTAITTAMLLALIFAIAFATAFALAQQERVDVYEGGKLAKSVIFVIGRQEYYVDGQARQMDAEPFIQSGRTFVPVRFLGYALGLAESDVGWDNTTQTAVLKRGSTTVRMTVGVPRIEVNGQGRDIDVAPVLRSEPSWRTYLPARFVAEALGYEVDWDGTLGMVVCWPKGGQKPGADLAKVAAQLQGNPYVPEGWVRVVYGGIGVYMPPGGENRYPNFWLFEKGTAIQFEDDAVAIRYPCKEFASESTDRLARELLLANIADPDMVEQLWEYGAQKTLKSVLPLKIFPGAGPFREIWVSNAIDYVCVRGFYKEL